MSGAYLILFYAIIVPLIIFAAHPETSRWIKSGRLILCVLGFELLDKILSLFGFELFYKISRYGISEWALKLYILAAAVLVSAVYVGWWEYLWRTHYKQWVRNLKQNFQYGIISTCIVLLSLTLTGTFLILLLSGQAWHFLSEFI